MGEKGYLWILDWISFTKADSKGKRLSLECELCLT